MMGLGGTAERCHLANGYDLATADGFNRCCDLVKTKRPKMAWASPPCSAFSAIQNLNARKDKAYQKRQRAKKTRAVAIASYAVRTCEFQLEQGR
eukprot:6717329-Alexandrium_andersonii.AAC.1